VCAGVQDDDGAAGERAEVRDHTFEVEVECAGTPVAVLVDREARVAEDLVVVGPRGV
jgi:hypothetical protein